MQEERDLVTFTGEDGEDFQLEVLDYVFYEGEEYAVLVDAEEQECDCGHDHDEDDDCEDCEGHVQEVYIMKVVSVGEDMEEFIPIDEDIADDLIAIVQTRLEGDFDGEGEYDEGEEGEADEEGEEEEDEE